MSIINMHDKVAIVTGAAGGIGRATAFAFAEAGASVTVSDVNLPGAEETAHRIERIGGQAIALRTDVTDDAEVAAMVQRTVNAFGSLDYAHNNAGIAYAPEDVGLVHEHSDALWNRILNIDLTGVWRCMKYELPLMMDGGGGAIVNTASVLGLKATPGYSAYIAAKHGVAGLTKAAALEYARYNIRVNAVCPGFIRTQMVDQIMEDQRMYKAWIAGQALRRPGEPQEVADVVVWLCSDAASFVTGHMMAVDGGQGAR